MAQGVCQQRAGQLEQAEKTLLHAYEIDAGNPALGFNLASVMFALGENERAQFYIRRVNNGEYSNAETLWLGVKIERALKDSVSMRQLGEQLRKRYPESKQARAYEAGSFNE
jgi:type IV pilus assembly protein PilF